MTETDRSRVESIERWALLGGVAGLLVASGIAPHDRFTWLLEVSWVVVGIPAAVLAQRRWSMTMLLARLLALHAVVLVIGGHYTYELVPLGKWFQDWFGLERNHYDRLGHFMQGFVPAILAREVLLRRGVLKRGFWLFLLVTCACLAFSAFFEMLEWWASLAWGEGARAYLGSQGDVWDAQWDMLMALVGAVVALLALGRLHDRELERMRAEARDQREAGPSTLEAEGRTRR
jgi:putative membrane protein